VKTHGGMRSKVNDKSGTARSALQLDRNLCETGEFLIALDPTTNRFTFQIFDDLRERRDPGFARIFHGPLSNHASKLATLNARGAGVFVCINATDLRGRATRHIKRVRAIWQDDDHGWQGEFPLIPSLVVSTSPGKFQRLWLCDDLTIDQHRVVQERLANSYGHDRQASDLSRVLRLPGFRHMKRPVAPHIVRLIGGNHRRYRAAEILAAFRPIERPPARTWHARSDDDERVRAALMSIPAEAMDHCKWVQIGMALRAHFGDSGLELWDAWSRQSQHYDRNGLERVWRSFRRSGVTIATVFHYAREHCRAA
jgi:Primase C terminal 2 (PriCT-2)/RepB DNA-primase from phage plasmid